MKTIRGRASVLTVPTLMAAALVLAMSGCTASEQAYDPAAHQFLPDPSPLQVQNGVPVLTQEQALADYDYMWSILTDNAAVVQEMENDPAWSGEKPSDMQAGSRSYFTADPTMSLSAFNDAIKLSLAPLQEKSHIYVLDDNYRQMWMYNYTDGWADTTTPQSAEMLAAFGRLASLNSTAKTDEYYKQLYYPGGPAPTSSTASSSNTSSEPSAADITRAQLFLITNILTSMKGNTPYLKVSSFMDPSFTDPSNTSVIVAYHSVLSDYLTQFFTENKDASDLIIDIRGNGGGSPKIWEDYLYGLLAAPDQTHQWTITGGFPMGGLNDYVWQDAYPLSPDQAGWAGDFAAGALDRFDRVFRETYTEQSSLNGIGYKGKIWLLVDGGTFSAGDQFTVFCEQTGFATVVGTPTGGAGMDSRIESFPLPNSGLLISYSAWCGINQDGTCNDLVGTAPDIDVGEQNALDVVLAQIGQ